MKTCTNVMALARELGIRVISEEQLLELIRTG